MKRQFLARAAALAIGLIAAPVTAASAGTLGDQIETGYYFPDVSTYHDSEASAFVAPTATFSYSAGELSAVVAPQTITLTIGEPVVYSTATFNGPRFFDLTAPDFGFAYLLSSTSPGFNGSRLSGDAAHININLADLTFTSGDTIVIGLNGVAPAPEPSLWLLMLGGVGILGGMLRMGQARRREEEAAVPA